MMQIETKFIPRMGTDIDFFERLSDYIIQFDPEWIKRIKSASSQDIQLLIELSGIKRNRHELPKYYRIFLEKMGEDDGELITSDLGTSHIKAIIELYEEIVEDDEETLSSEYLMFYEDYLGTEKALEIGKNENPMIVEFSDGYLLGSCVDSFEKLLFQSAFEKYTKWDSSVGFCASGKDLKRAMSNSLDRGVSEWIEDIINQYNLKKMWISDKRHYICYNEKVVLYIFHRNLMHGVYGHVSGGDKNYTINLAQLVSNRLGAHVEYQTF